MKNMKKLASILLALVMVLAMATTAFAATIVKNPADLTGPASITVTLPKTVEAGETNEYKIYKVFDAVADGDNISYTLVTGKTVAPAGFSVDAQGNVSYSGTSTTSALTDADIAAIKGYVDNNMLVATVTTVEGDSAFTVTGLPYGYYYITTTTGTVITVNSTTPNANVADKNTVPTVDKTVTDAADISNDGKDALAQLGTNVEFTGKIDVKVGAIGYVYHDTMSSGLSFNNDVAVYIDADDDGELEESEKIATAADTWAMGTPAANETFSVEFADEWIAAQAGNSVYVVYTAKITEEAYAENPETNEAYLEYGNDPGENKTPTTNVEVYNAKITVTKKDGEGEALAGAGFILKNGEDKYYKLDNGVVTWVDEADADVHTSVADGTVPAFTGLANGTYTLIEKVVPAGYNKAADVNITIDGNNYTNDNLQKSQTVVNQAGSVLPSTGGIGTTIFYVSGAVLAIAAVVFLVTKKRMSGEEE